VIFGHDTEAALLSAVELTNSADDPQELATPAALSDFYERHRYTGRHDGTRRELAEVLALRPVLRELLTSSRDDAVGIVNAMLADAAAIPQLVRHGDEDWHIHATAADSPLATRIVVETAMAMVDLIRTDELSRIDICADEACDRLVLDLSRNRSKRFCSTTCGNRNAVAAYRARQRVE